jgi:hypothetical protein
VAEPNLVSLSLSAFVAVVVLLSVLALVIRGLAFVFRDAGATAEAATLLADASARSWASGAPSPSSAPPGAAPRLDAPLVAALHAALARSHPQHRIVRIEEESP